MQNRKLLLRLVVVRSRCYCGAPWWLWVTEPDPDGTDVNALHLWANSDTETVVAYARIFLGEGGDGYSRIGRVLTAQSVRRLGLGRELMQRALDVCHTYTPTLPIRLGAQVYLRAFYESFGFVAISKEYLEDDIPHIDMERQP
ncbi:MAG: GNAT family N-acetyltransferase [Idiomarina sp.]|nr:MAG: GNAT family N-acetyltransferase [Idiomarina sp.]